MSTGIRCPNCGFTATRIPEAEVPRLRLPSATVTCPKCHRIQPAAECWVAFEQWQADQRQGLKAQYLPGRIRLA